MLALAIALISGAFVAVLLWAAVVSVRRHKRQIRRTDLERFERLRAEVFRVEARRRKQVRSELSRYFRYVRAISELSCAINVPSPGSPRAELKDTARIVASEDVAILSLAGDIRGMWPPPRRTLRSRPSDETLKPASELLEFLNLRVQNGSSPEAIPSLDNGRGRWYDVRDRQPR